MSHRAHVEVVNQTLNDLKNLNAIMGEVFFDFIGDFRHAFPVIAKGIRVDISIIKACLKSSL